MANNNKQENEITSIEDLPNELFGEIFSYLNGNDASFSLIYLNRRFQCLVKEYCQRLDFKSITKSKFDLIFEEYDTQWCQSLSLSNDHHTYGQIEYFLQFYSLIDHFSQLKSLTLYNRKSIDTFKLLSQIFLLTNLVSLTLKPICGKIMSEFDFFNLKRLAITSCKNTTWIKKFSQLDSLEYTMNNCCLSQIVLAWPVKLKHLKIVFDNDDVGVLVPQSLTYLSELSILEIYQKKFGKSLPNGQVWEQLIRSSFPELKKFKFYFPFDYGFVSIKKEKKVLSSFSTSFYLEEKKWFIRCDIFTVSGIAIIYSLPFTFDQYTIISNSSSGRIVTLSNSNFIHSDKDLYKHMKTVIIESISEWDLEDAFYTKHNKNTYEQIMLNFISAPHFNSIERLHLLPNYYRYRNEYNIKILSNSFYILLKKISHLYVLEIDLSDLQFLTENWTNVILCCHLSENIRSLILHSNKHRRQFLDGNEVDQIIRVFSTKCQYLSVCVLSSIHTIISLLRNMKQLHSMHVFVQTKDNEEINMKWLEKQNIGLNYSNCFITNDEQNYYFWLR
ncbi:unnamed protein product [Adineta steineri]|uniref:F-box domain-containing protein n=2 Tax=Adineta steineri TaxID=433720 RepID=A0A820A5I0_9BILA|nr:unnamed protein product [Adineta steineri]